MEEKRKAKLNIVDIVVIAVILLAAVFFAMKLIHRDEPIVKKTEPGTVRFVVEIYGIRKDTYEESAAMLPCRMAASGKLVDGYILESWANDVTVQSTLAKSPVNASQEQYLDPEDGVEYVNAYYRCEVMVDLNDRLNLVGNQEIRLGRSYFLKSVDLEFNGTIISMEKFPGEPAWKAEDAEEEESAEG